MSAALIVTTFNCRDELSPSLEIFACPENLALLQEIVIVDGGSTDGTWELLQEWSARVPRLRVFRVEGANISRGRNEAIQRTTADVIVGFDSGCRYDKAWLPAMLEPFESPDVDVVGGSTAAYGSTPFEKALAQFYDRKHVGERINPSHRGVAYRRKVWEAIGGYPEDVLAGEDTWFNTQWRKRGFAYVNVDTSRIRWRVRGSWKSVFRMMRRNTAGHVTKGDPTGMQNIAFVTLLYLSWPVVLVLGFLVPPLWLFWLAIYLAYASLRLLRGARKRYFMHPGNFFTGWWVLKALDVGTSVGALEGLGVALRRALLQRNHKQESH